ncbi:MAG TPA: pilus assembly protein TadG-related protein [Vicinamibacterales bacterium]|nr:hypothetical protein [Acidobacteriota bacterium]HQX82622.1 pilus assembly protein TadG-related protein [Vicinamibacterales bacterium]
MTTRQPTPAANERGAILVHVAFALLAVMALSAVVTDFGVLWVGRRQAQNSADAGALAGVIALAFDSPSSVTDTAAARQSAATVAQRNFVWGQAPSVVPETDITFGPCPDGVNTCVRVDVFRDQARGNPLPMYFGRLIGLEAQGVRATATGMVQPANATRCLKPWGLPDKWIENHPTPGPWLPTSTFDAYDKKGKPLANPDVYIPPSASGPGSGFTVEADFGLRLTLKPSSDPISPGFYNALQLTGTGGSDYRYNISHCTETVWGIGDSIPIEPGNMTGPTGQGARDLIDLDPGATWVGGASPIAGSCVTTGGCPAFTVSPRVVAIPVYDVNVFVSEGKDHGRHTTVLVRNILGFFVAGVQGSEPYGYLMTGPGIYEPGGGSVPPESAFLRTVTLVR